MHQAQSSTVNRVGVARLLPGPVLGNKVIPLPQLEAALSSL